MDEFLVFEVHGIDGLTESRVRHNYNWCVLSPGFELGV